MACALLALGGATTASADFLISGDTAYEFGSQLPPATSQDFKIEIALGYGLASNTVGKDIWIDSVGVLSLTDDPALPELLSHATNGVNEMMTITVSNVAGESYEVLAPEWALLSPFSPSQYPDLAGYAVSRIDLQVFGFYPPGTAASCGFVTAGWNFWGTPEPSAVLLLISGSVLALFRRSRDKTSEIWNGIAAGYP